MFALTLALATLPATGQPALTPSPAHNPTGTAPPSCSAPADLVPAQLYGRWQLSLWPQSAQAPAEAPTASGTIHFERHPEFPDSVRGRLQHQINGHTTEALVSGDVIHGEFNLDESADGQRIDAVWTGNVSATGCGQDIRGVRLPAQHQAGEPMNFVLRKSPGWD